MGKRNKKKRHVTSKMPTEWKPPEPEASAEESIEEPVETVPEALSAEETPQPYEEPTDVDFAAPAGELAEEEPDAWELADEPYEPECITDPQVPKVSKTLLILGILLSLAGIIGYLGLRLGFVQYLFGITDPYPGIGSAEPSGHIVSSIPFVLGLVTLAVWGIKYDPVYHELERMKEEADEPDEEMPEGFARQMADIESPLTADTIPEEFIEPLSGLEGLLAAEPEPYLTAPSEELKEPDESFEEMFADLGDLELPLDTQPEETPMVLQLEDDLSLVLKPVETVPAATESDDEPLSMLQLDDDLSLVLKPDEGVPAVTESDDELLSMLQLEEELSSIAGEDDTVLQEAPEPFKGETAEESIARLKSQFAEEMRVERCKKMLGHVLVLPDDKQRLITLIGSGISIEGFTDELEKAVNRRKKKEAEMDVTADEKASLLEDELISELAELEVEAGENSEKLEEDIIKDIEDLEKL